MASLTLLDLPPEILTSIFLELPETHVLTCQRINKYLREVINQSVELQYYIRLAIADQIDNPHCKLPIKERMQWLNERERRWENLDHQFHQVVDIKHTTSGIYDLTGDIYLLGNVTRKKLHYWKLPNTQEEPKWMEVSSEGSELIVDMGLCVHEHNLLVMITLNQSVTDSYEIRVVLLDVTTGNQHPQAKYASFIATTVRWERPAIGIEIVGENLVLVVAYHNNPFKPNDLVYVYEWKTAKQRMVFSAPYHSYSGLIFATEDIFILPNTAVGTLEFWKIPTDNSDHTASEAPILSLSLPKTNTPGGYNYISCRAEPNISTSLRHSTKPFHSNPQHAISIFNINVRTGLLHQIAAINQPIQWSYGFMLFVHRSSLVNCLTKFPSYVHGIQSPIPYNEWGPSVCRWLNSDTFPTRWITTTAGQRAILIPELSREENAHFVMLNFNQFDVRKVLEMERESLREEVPSIPDVDEKREDIDADEEVEMEGVDTEEVETLEVDNDALVVDNDSSEHGFRELELYPDAEDDDNEEDWIDVDDDEAHEEEIEIPDIEAMLTYMPPLRVRAHQRLDEPLNDPAGCFEEPVYSSLPYTAISSPETHSFMGLLLDEDRIIGLRTDELDRINAIEVFYYG